MINPKLSPIIVTIQDARDAGLCVIGLREWFKLRDLNFKAFIINGIDANSLPVDDCMCLAAIGQAKKRLLKEPPNGQA